MHSGTISGSMFNKLEILTICTLQGIFVEATTVSGFTISPSLQCTSPLSGSCLTFCKVVPFRIFNPGV